MALTGSAAGAPETPGILFRTASDGSMGVWRHLDDSLTQVKDGEQVLAVDGQPTARWLTQAAALTFGGNPRSRMAEAALKLGVGTPADHALAGLGKTLHLTVRGGDGAPRDVALDYRPMGKNGGAALAQALERPDLPLPTTASDLADGGAAAVQRIVAELARRGMLAPRRIRYLTRAIAHTDQAVERRRRLDRLNIAVKTACAQQLRKYSTK